MAIFFFLEQVLAGFVSLLGVLNCAVPAGVGWTAVVFNLVLALAFGYFGFQHLL